MPETDQFWDQKRKSPYRWIASIIHLGLIYGGFVYLLRSRHFQGAGGIYLFSVGLIVVTTIHELGHATVAWALGFKFHALNIGPLTIVRDHYGHRHFLFDWNRLLGHGGYAAATPVSEEHIRSNAIMMVFAGPFASLNAGLLCWLIYLKVPGTAWEAHWGIPGILAILFVADFVGNLIPIGYCDGTMLLHLILWTKHGQDLYAIHLASKTHDDATQRLVEQDFAGEVKLRQKALDQLKARGDSPTLQLGHSYQALGFAQLNNSQKREAAANFQQSIEVFQKCSNADPVFEANSWKGLEKVYRIRQLPEEAQKAARAALAAFEKSRNDLNDKMDRPSAAGIGGAIAQLHADLRHYGEGLREIEKALAMLPDSPKYLMKRAELMRLEMRCEAGLENFGLAKAATNRAAAILRSPKIPETERTHAASAMGSLAATAWMAGGADNAAELFLEAIQALEKKGPSSRAVQLRIVLASVLRKECRFAEAETALPEEGDFEPERRRTFLEVRGEIYAETDRAALAVADGREALKLVQQEPEENPVGVASAQAKLAEFLLADGKIDDAAELARQACDELMPRRHVDAAGALVTLALILNNESSEAYVEEALRLVRESPLGQAGTTGRALAGLQRRAGRLQPTLEPARK
ncbi:MAG TPA: site-2 protease family protein [Bryobacteraceae bacterium]|nr:site-2 protease family protein [Bryobacteraceae bacterium]